MSREFGPAGKAWITHALSCNKCIRVREVVNTICEEGKPLWKAALEEHE